MVEAVIAHFSRFGTILESLEGQDAANIPESKRTWSGRNWVQITYKDGMSAGRALAENGTVFSNMFVIGCVLATEANMTQLHTAGERSMIESQPNFNGTGMNGGLPGDIMEEGGLGALSPMPVAQPARGVSRTTSMPALVSSATPRKIIQVHKGNSIYSLNTGSKDTAQNGTTGGNGGARRAMRFSPSLANIKSQPEAERSQRSQGFLSFAAKRARELVFGWDDL
jgi:hypothetical protein